MFVLYVFLLLFCRVLRCLGALHQYGRIMKMLRKYNYIALLFIGVAPACLAPFAYGDEADVVNFTLTSTTVWDDNLFRTPSGGTQSRVSDVIQTTSLGAGFNKTLGVQKFSGNISMADTRYRDHDNLNRKGLNYDGRWGWSMTQRLTGDLSFDHSEGQNSFSQYQAANQRNTRTTENERFNLDYWLHSSWHAVLGLYRQSTKNELPLFEESDFEAEGAYLGVKYMPRSGNSIGFQVKDSQGRYVNRTFSTATQLDNKYSEPSYELNANWQLTGKTSVNGRLSYLRREHEHFSSRDYQGWGGQFGVRYALTQQTSMNANYTRSLTAAQSATSSYAIFDELAVTAQWQATAKISLAANASYSEREYRGELTPLASGSDRRRDKMTRAGLDLTWKPSRWLDLKTGYVNERRDSNGSQSDYLDRRWTLTALLRY